MQGFVASLVHPGGNITGVSTMSPPLSGKQLEFLKETVPMLSRLAVLMNPGNATHAEHVRETQGAAQALGVQLHHVAARQGDPFDDAFAAMTRERAEALLGRHQAC
jgi:putative ABC transport system substrate-binding protein